MTLRTPTLLLRHLLLALALVLGQAAVTVHAAEHVVDADHIDCQVCLHAQAQTGAPATQAGLPPVAASMVTALAAAPAAPVRLVGVAHPIRGPPVSTP